MEIENVRLLETSILVWEGDKGIYLIEWMKRVNWREGNVFITNLERYDFLYTYCTTVYTFFFSLQRTDLYEFIIY